MQWRHLLFIHWPVPVNALRPLIPEGLEIDTFDGSAWVGLVPFTMRDVLPAFLPRVPGLARVPRLSAFHECNVRTYVHPKGRPDEAGVWFFSLDAASRAAVWTARRLFHLAYFHSRIELQQNVNEVRYLVDRIDAPRATMRCTWRIGDALPQSQPGELAHFLTERFMMFSADGDRRLHRGRVRHERWTLRSAELMHLDDRLVRAAGIEVPKREPILHYAEVMDTHAWRLERV